jgi:3alpha(or 20beta)-hydroxysteroid dehydrogenase
VSAGTRLAGKVAVISGGARGMGLSHANAFLAEDARVVAFDLNDPDPAQLSKVHGGDRVVFLRGDVTRRDDWDAVVATAIERFGRVDVLVNNAGISPIQRLETVSEDEYRRVIDINQVGTFLGMQAVIPVMRKRGGSIVNIASTAALVGFEDIFPYVASKWAVRGMTKAAALELVSDGIRVNAVCPGDTETPMILEVMESGSAAAPDPADLPFGRWARPEEVSAAVVFLASDESSYMSGTEIVVDGAFTAQ